MLRTFWFRASGVLLAVLALPGCAFVERDHVPRPPTVVRSVTLNGHPLTLHVSRGTTPGAPLLVFATGDGGWRGKDLALYRRLVSWGYPTVGFGAPEYLKHLRGVDGTTTPNRLAADYARIMGAARQALALSEQTPVILVGVSRGAGLSVAAAGQPTLRSSLAGVVAVALTKEEEYVRFRPLRRARARATPEMLQIYEYLPRLGPVPIAVIQSTRDKYLPAEEARALFGPDSTSRRFLPVDARNHSFAGARDVLYDGVKRSLAWISALASTPLP